MRPQLDDINREIESIALELSQIPDSHPNSAGLLTRLGNAHGKRYHLLGELNDIQKEIEYTLMALSLASGDDPGLPDLLSALGRAHTQRFYRQDVLHDIDRAIDYNSRALAATSNTHSADLSQMFGNLGLSYAHRFRRLGEPSDLDKAIEHQLHAVSSIRIPRDYPQLSHQLNNLGTFHSERFHCLGEMDDIHKSIHYQSSAVAVAPNGYPLLPAILSNLGISHIYRFRRLNELDDLKKSIEYTSRALSVTPVGDPDISSRLLNVGASYAERFQRSGELEDLDKAIEHYFCALGFTAEDHPRFLTCLANLGTSHNKRFHLLGELGDLEKSIGYNSRALALISRSNGHPHLPHMLTGLGLAHTDRFEFLGDLDDLENAIKYTTRAVTSTPDNSPHLPNYLANLAGAHLRRFRHLSDLDDLEMAIEYGSRGVTLTPNDHRDLLKWLANLGVLYSQRFERLRNLDDLDKALKYESRVLDLAPDGHPNVGSWYFNRGVSYIHYYEYSKNVSYLEESLWHFRKASKSLVGPPRDKFRHAREWAKLASKDDSDRLKCIEAYQVTIDLLPQYIWLGAANNQRYANLSTIQTLAVDAAYVAITSSGPTLALEWLEHTRCIVWNQNLMLRSPVDHLESSHPLLASRLQTVAKQLHGASSESRAPSSDSATLEEATQEHHRLAKEYNKLISETRKLPGFENFLQPMKANRLVQAARNRPIVVINCHEDRCDALLILPQQESISHVPLSNFNEKKARRAFSEMEIEGIRFKEREVGRRPLVPEDKKIEFENMLADLWYDVVKPVLDFLGYTNIAPMSNLPHITWCPTGAMTFLPLHAAGDYTEPQSRVFNYAISSYTPTVTALLESVPYSFGCHSRVLAVGQTTTPGHPSLPGTAVELECVKSHTHGKAKYSQLMDEEANITAVLDGMEDHDWVHIACHAHQNVGDSTESGFFLSNGVLDLASINRRLFKNKGLAFLSACQTATGDEKLPNEAVHLASGMLMAGYTSVIATMWSVMDSDAPLVADNFYSQLVSYGKLGNGEAGVALHNAVAVLRERVGEQEFERWVPYIHIGS